MPGHNSLDIGRCLVMGGLLAFMYFFEVSLLMPSSRPIHRIDRPFRLALCTAFHLAYCSSVGFIRGEFTGLQTLLVPLGLATAMRIPTC